MSSLPLSVLPDGAIAHPGNEQPFLVLRTLTNPTNIDYVFRVFTNDGVKASPRYGLLLGGSVVELFLRFAPFKYNQYGMDNVGCVDIRFCTAPSSTVDLNDLDKFTLDDCAKMCSRDITVIKVPGSPATSTPFPAVPGALSASAPVTATPPAQAPGIATAPTDDTETANKMDKSRPIYFFCPGSFCSGSAPHFENKFL